MRHLNNFVIFFLVAISNSSYAVPESGKKIMISARSPYAIAAGKEIYSKGGNIADVAVAVGLTLAVTSPGVAALGGGGLALIKFGPNVEALDFREVAPGATSPTYYKNLSKNASTVGGTAVGVPGMLKGYWEIHKKYGKLKWKEILKTPIYLARHGFQVSGSLSKTLEVKKEIFNNHAFRYFFKPKKRRSKLSRFFKGKKVFANNDIFYQPGDTLKQPQLALALDIISNHGEAAFYNGEISKDVVTTVRKSKGVMTLNDLKNYKVRWLKPHETSYYGHKIYMMPPPSSGGLVIEGAFKLIEAINLEKEKPQSVMELHLLSEIMNRSFRKRSLLGDPDFTNNPTSFFKTPAAVKSALETIKRDKHTELDPLGFDPQEKEGTQTTHFSIMDHQGRAISATITLNTEFGSGVVTPRFGIALNNEMDDFTTHPGEPNTFGLVQGKANVVEPGKRPLSSMSPTLVEKDKKIIMAIGAEGGPRIISAVLQIIYRVIVSNFDIEHAIHSPKVHAQFLPRTLFVDGMRWPPETLDGLKTLGHEINETDELHPLGRSYGVHRNPDGILEGAYDWRHPGAAGGF